MIGNPEFRRNLWLELTTYRLIGMPAVLGALFYLVAVLSPDPARASLVPYALTLYSVIVFLWGTRQSSESVMAEVRDRTWDQQRMSSIGPWAMTWGKLLGSTIFPWYGGLLCLAVYVALTAGVPGARTVTTAALFLVSGLLAHSVALLSSMLALKKDRIYNRSQAAAYLIVGVMVAGPFLSWAFSASQNYRWYGSSYESRNFILVVAVLFLGWTVAGIYRLMRTELQMKSGPFVWLSFVCFLAVFLAGFSNADDPAERLFNRLAVAGSISVLLAYQSAFGERKDPIGFKRIVMAYRKKDWRRLLLEVPCWIVTLVPVALFASALMLAGEGFPDASLTAAHLRLMILAVVFFLVRDLALLLFFNFAQRPKHADMLMVLFLALLYGVIPGILSALWLSPLTVLFWPRGDDLAGYAALAAGAEAVFAVLLASNRWRTRYGKGVVSAA